MKTFKKGLSKRFETFSKVEGYAKHTPTPHKARCRFFETLSKDNTYASAYVGTPSSSQRVPKTGVTRDVLKGRNPLLLR